MILRFLKVALIGVAWSYFYLLATQNLFVHFWHFDYLSPAHWKQIGWFWERGGVIREGKDYLFLLSLLMIIPFWMIGWRLLYKVNYLDFHLLPLTLYNRWMIKRYGSNSQRIVLRNIGFGKKTAEEIKEKTAAIKPQSWNEADKIREAVQQKLNTGK